MPQPEFSEKNINVETVEDCNLLCKLIIDYLDTEECIIEKEGTNSFRIAYPEGSFINYKDTSYELTYAYFCYPSRHSIDGQKYDLEVNLYHGNFTNGSTNKGIVAHTHYHMDTEESNQHKHFHTTQLGRSYGTRLRPIPGPHGRDRKPPAAEGFAHEVN